MKGRHGEDVEPRWAKRKKPEDDDLTQDMFGKPPAASSSSGRGPTDSGGCSRAASASMGPIEGEIWKEIIALLRAKLPDGLTSDELEVVTGRPHQTISSALWKMKKAGVVRLVEGSTRLNRSGRKAMINYLAI
jgi:hypothetical protein